ncbi:MAG: extracellular solute-binding protein [Erysipelotrichaceae bacterium]|jgi:iron(III) transport system substrate-binding protein|nr:extracellular solute-binding protein [Erysipelotrichaceae bacterium]
MKKFFKLLMVALLACSLVACSSGGGETPAEEPAGSDDLVIYSPNSDPLIEVAYTFGEKYGINVEVVSAGTGECLERIAAEKDNPQGDIMYGGMNYANSFNPDYVPLFEQYVAEGDGTLPEAYQNFNGVTTHYCLDGSAALLINTEEYEKLGLNVDDFDSYADLLQPELNGKIAMGDPANSSSAWAELTNMLLVMGDEPYDEKAWEWVGEFIKNLNGIQLSSSSAIYKGVVQGEYVVGVSYEDPCVGLLVDGATNVKLVYPSEGAVWLPAGVAIIKNAPNMENAKKFVDWLISDEGQAEVAKTTARPVNPAISNTAKEMTPFSAINVVYEDMALCGSNKKAWQARWTEMFTAANPQ